MSLPTPRAVFFDLDGTLIDSYDAITSSVNHVRRNRSLEPLTVDEVRSKVGHGVEKLLRSTVPGTDLASDIPLYKEHHQVACVQYTRLLPGAVELLDLLAKHGIGVGICSNKPKGFTRLILQAVWHRMWPRRCHSSQAPSRNVAGSRSPIECIPCQFTLCWRHVGRYTGG
jgi:phosphoglycolate phosphatase